MKKGAFVGFLLIVALFTAGLYHLLHRDRMVRHPFQAAVVEAPPAPPLTGQEVPVPAPEARPGDDREEQRQLILNHLQAGRLEAATALLTQDAGTQPGDRELRIALARRLVGAGRHDEAIHHYRLALGEIP